MSFILINIRMFYLVVERRRDCVSIAPPYLVHERMWQRQQHMLVSNLSLLTFYCQLRFVIFLYFHIVYREERRSLEENCVSKVPGSSVIELDALSLLYSVTNQFAN